MTRAEKPRSALPLTILSMFHAPSHIFRMRSYSRRKNGLNVATTCSAGRRCQRAGTSQRLNNQIFWQRIFLPSSDHCDSENQQASRFQLTPTGRCTFPEPGGRENLPPIPALPWSSDTTLEVFTRVGPDNSLERLTERSVGLVTDRLSDVYELLVALFE